jgi:hypothetical protein
MVGNVLTGEYLNSVHVPTDTVLWPHPYINDRLRGGPIWRTGDPLWTDGRDNFMALETDRLYEVLRVPSKEVGDTVYQGDLDSLPMGVVLVDRDGMVAQSYPTARSGKRRWSSTVGGICQDGQELWAYLAEPVTVLRLPTGTEK